MTVTSSTTCCDVTKSGSGGVTRCDTFLKHSKSVPRLSSNSEVKQSFKSFIPTVTQFVAKLIIDQKDDPTIFGRPQTRKNNSS